MRVWIYQCDKKRIKSNSVTRLVSKSCVKRQGFSEYCKKRSKIHKRRIVDNQLLHFLR